ncbi:MAG: hypothetical protein M1319_03585 [Chloroflexi bacterium]|nr:hypothetical protein [Chloroflexota bacterium]
MYLTPNRFYSPSVGRWLSPDPTGGDVMHPQSLNRYAYVSNNPATLDDPLGLFEEDPMCNDASYAISHADCSGEGLGCNPLVSYVCNLEVLCQQFGYCGGGSVGGGGAPAPPSPPPAGQPPLGGMGNALQPYPTPIIFNWPWAIRVTSWGWPYINVALQGALPVLGAVNPWSPQAQALKASVNNPKGYAQRAADAAAAGGGHQDPTAVGEIHRPGNESSRGLACRVSEGQHYS